jgi:hypothetical protein
MNAESRIQNAKITNRESQLTPLVSYQTQELIPNFPQTPKAIPIIPGTIKINAAAFLQITNIFSSAVDATLVTILQHLEQDTDGGIEEQRQRLRAAIGLSEELA